MTRKWSNLIKFLLKNDCVGVILNFFQEKNCTKSLCHVSFLFFGGSKASTPLVGIV
jgi:hypothetical protein